jgi:hypothetical protein
MVEIDINTTEITLIASSIISYIIAYSGLWNTADCTRTNATDNATSKWSHVFFLIWLFIIVIILVIFYIIVKWFRIDNYNFNISIFSISIILPIVALAIIIGRMRYLAVKKK